MNGWEAVAVVAAGMGAGGINAVVGSGSLITFPTLLAVGYAPGHRQRVQQHRTGSRLDQRHVGFRRELAGQAPRARTLAIGSASRSLIGAALLLTLPSEVFDAVVPILVLGAALLMAVQPKLSGWVAGRRKARRPRRRARPRSPSPSSPASTAGTSARPRASSC